MRFFESEYKKSRNNIPDLPYISDERKKFINELTYTFLLPPPQNCIGKFDSPYYEYPLYKNGGISYKYVMEEIMEEISF